MFSGIGERGQKNQNSEQGRAKKIAFFGAVIIRLCSKSDARACWDEQILCRTFTFSTGQLWNGLT